MYSDENFVHETFLPELALQRAILGAAAGGHAKVLSKALEVDKSFLAFMSQSISTKSNMLATSFEP